MREPRRLLIAGDWHGHTRWAVDVVTYAWMQGCDAIIQLGDFGFWVDNDQTSRYLTSLQDILAETGIQLYWLDGNHEDHGRIGEMSEYGPWHDQPFSSICYLPRGWRWEWFGQTWMAVGGAVSVDKHLRTQGVDWWVEETLTDEQVEYCTRPGKVDVIVSHDCPSGVDIPGLSPPGTFPQWCIYEADIHRRKLREIWDKTGAKRLYHGHYHSRYDAELGDGLISGLDMDGTTMQLNTIILGE